MVPRLRVPADATGVHKRRMYCKVKNNVNSTEKIKAAMMTMLRREMVSIPIRYALPPNWNIYSLVLFSVLLYRRSALRYLLYTASSSAVVTLISLLGTYVCSDQ